jgi:dTMP kinase
MKKTDLRYHIEFDLTLKRNPYRGLYIALEGIDGSGKTTQVGKLYDYFKSQGKEVVRTREPRKSEGMIGKLLQEVLEGSASVPSVAFQYLFSAERQIHHTDIIIPSLKEGKTVITDRCFWSSVPYGLLDQASALSESSGNLMLVAQSILSFYHQFIVPDFTFYLDIPLVEAMRRIDQMNESTIREIYEDKLKIEKVITGYQWLLHKFPQEFNIINSNSPINQVTDEIIKTLQSVNFEHDTRS